MSRFSAKVHEESNPDAGHKAGDETPDWFHLPGVETGKFQMI